MNAVVKKRILEYDVKVSCGNTDICTYVGKMVPKGETKESYRYGCPECGRINMTLRKGINNKVDLSKSEMCIN